MDNIHLIKSLLHLPKDLLSAQNGKHSDCYGNGCCRGFAPLFPYHRTKICGTRLRGQVRCVILLLAVVYPVEFDWIYYGLATAKAILLYFFDYVNTVFLQMEHTLLLKTILFVNIAEFTIKGLNFLEIWCRIISNRLKNYTLISNFDSLNWRFKERV